MTKVLLVEDEPLFRQQLEFCLAQRGHELRTAANGRDAIEIGCRYRPDVLVTDWLLNDSIHGLHVAEALRAVWPTTQVILITGFSSHDLEHAARAAAVSRVLEKPFTVDKLDRLVRELAAAEATVANHLNIPVFETDADGMFVGGNEPARQLLGQSSSRQAGGQPSGVTAPAAPPPDSPRSHKRGISISQLDAAVNKWIPLQSSLAADSTPFTDWQMRARRLGSQGWLVVLRPLGQSFFENLPVVRLLLGIAEPGQPDYALRGHTLVVARETVVRQVIGGTLAALDCVFHSADSLDDAGRLFRNDSRVGLVIVHAAGFADLPSFVVRLKSIRPQVMIVRPDRIAPGGIRSAAGGGLMDVVLELLDGRMGICESCMLPVYCVRFDPTLDGQLPRCTCADPHR